MTRGIARVESTRAELNEAIDAIARRRLHHAVRALDAAIHDIRQTARLTPAAAIDRLLDARNELTGVKA